MTTEQKTRLEALLKEITSPEGFNDAVVKVMHVHFYPKANNLPPTLNISIEM